MLSKTKLNLNTINSILWSITELSPVFTKPLPDITLKEGETAEFVCEVSKEGATVKWFLDGKEINEDERYLIIPEGRITKLVIKDAILPDSGVITAKVEDETLTAQFTVEGKFINFALQFSESMYFVF